MREYRAVYGCYLERNEFKLITDLPEEAISEQLYQLAYQSTDGWVGMHGFCPEEDFEDMDEDERSEAVHEEIENALEYFFEPWKPEHEAYGHGDVETWKRE